MKTFNVLITGAGTTNALSVLKGLRETSDPTIRIIIGDMQPDCAGAHLGDEFVLMPPAVDPLFDKKIVEICRTRRIDLVVPIIDDEFEAWSRTAPALADAGTRVIISIPRVIAQCKEKDLTIKYFTEINVPCPRTWRVGDISDPSKLPFPLFLKPRCGRGSRNTHRADNVKEYRYYVAKRSDMIVQPYLEGDEVTIDTMSDLEGRFLAASPRIRTEVKSGQAYRSVTIDAPELITYAKRIVESLPIIGPSNIQCFLTNNGPHFFEINPRFAAGTILSIAAGLNGPAALVAMARGHAIAKLAPRPKVSMFRYWQEVFVERRGWPIFIDLDGPLLDVSHRHYQVYSDILKTFKKHPIPLEQYWTKKRAHHPLSAIVSETEGTDFYTETFEQEWFDRIEAEEYLALDRLWPWAVDTLAILHRNHELYLVTVRSNPEGLRKQLDRLGLTRWFQSILCRPARQNAAQEKVKAIRGELKVLPPQGIMVGDTEADIGCGKELGFVTVGVLSGIRDRKRLQSTGCDYLVEDILALAPLVKRLCGGKNGIERK